MLSPGRPEALSKVPARYVQTDSAIIAFLKKGVKWLFSPFLGGIVRNVFAKLSAPPILVLRFRRRGGRTPPAPGVRQHAVEDAPRPFRVYASIDVSALCLGRSTPRIPRDPLPMIAWIPLPRRGIGLQSIWKLIAYILGDQASSRLILGYELSHCLGSQDSGKYRKSWEPQPASLVVSRVCQRVRLSPRVSKGKRQQ